jgi:hypothetical protein
MSSQESETDAVTASRRLPSAQIVSTVPLKILIVSTDKWLLDCEASVGRALSTTNITDMIHSESTRISLHRILPLELNTSASSYLFRMNLVIAFNNVWYAQIPDRSFAVDNSEGGCDMLDELVTVVVTDEIGSVDVAVTIESLIGMTVPVPFASCLDGCFIGDENTWCGCLEVVVLLLVVVVEVGGTVF